MSQKLLQKEWFIFITAYRAVWTYFEISGIILEDAFYPLAKIDEDGNPLDASNNYTLTL